MAGTIGNMKAHLLLATVLILAGCGRQNQSGGAGADIAARLDKIESQLAAQRSQPVHWAFANKREIESAVSRWSQQKMDEIKKSETLSPETEEKIRQYESLVM